MSRQVVRVSDITGEPIQNPEDATKLVVEYHPAFPDDTIELDVLPEQVEESLANAQEYVAFSYFSPDDDSPKRGILPLAEFADLFQNKPMEEALQQALASQIEEQGAPVSRRGRRAERRGERQRRPRKDFTSPEYAGEPHRGRITDAEKEYVRNNLRKVNARLDRNGYRTIDPNDPEMAERYGLHATQTAAVEEEMQDQANL
jgi:hypothetical protein